MMQRITFFTAILATPFLIQAMDEPDYIIPQAIPLHKKDVHQLCSATYLMFNDFQSNDKKSAKKLVTIIERMNSLKLACPPITEREIGFFIYQTKPELSLVDSFKKPFFNNLPGPLFASVFFARLAQYNDTLEKKVFVSPNKQQICHYLKKQETAATVLRNNQRNVPISQQAINESTISTPGSVDVEEFAIFMNDIKDILKDSPKEIKRAAKLIYHDELKGRITTTS